MSSASQSWAAQYERDLLAQKGSGPITFTEEQRSKNKEVQSRVVDLLPFQDAYKASDCDLIYRFLIGKHWNVALAEKGLREYVELRKKERLDGLIGEQLHPTIGSVLCPCDSHGAPCPIYGLDRDGLPILWLSPDAGKVIAAMKEFTDEELLRGQMRAIELGRFACLAHGVDRCTYVIDLGGITMTSVNKATLGFLKGVMNILQVAYPEIMRRLLIFNTGWAVSAAWKVLRPLVDGRVQDKIKFESGAPTLAALQPYMTADQVHPAFGGTGKENVLDAIIEKEVRRVRRHSEGGHASESATPIRGLSATIPDDGSLFDFDPHALRSFYCPTPGTACPTPSETLLHPHHHREEAEAEAVVAADRLLVGAPRALSAWMANMNDDTEAKDALDMSLSAASSSGDYETPKARDLASSTTTTAERPHSSPSSPLLHTRRSAGAATAPGAPAAVGFAAGGAKENGPSSAKGAAPGPGSDSERDALPSVAIALTYGADGSITGYLGHTCVGEFRGGRLYQQPRDPESTATPASASSPATSPSTASPGQFPSKDNRRSSAAPSSSAGGRSPGSPRSRGVNGSPGSDPPIGELLFEAGHPIHNFYIVCDGQRNARFLLRRSRLRTRLAVYNVVGGGPLRTEKNDRHYVTGERVKLGVAVASTDPAASGKGDWVLYGEDVTKRSPGQQLKMLFSKGKKGNAALVKDSSSDGAFPPKDKEPGWPASIFSGRRPSTASGVKSPSKKKPERAATPPKQSSSGDFDGSAQLLAASRGQTVCFYNLLTKNPTADLFVLAVAITLAWSGELEERKDKFVSKSKRYASDDDDIIT